MAMNIAPTRLFEQKLSHLEAHKRRKMIFDSENLLVTTEMNVYLLSAGSAQGDPLVTTEGISKP